MKKILIGSLIVITFVAMAAPAFAASWNGAVGSTAAVTTIIAGATFAPSTGVYVTATTDANGTVYCVTSVHNSSLGNAAGKAFGALSTSSTINYSLNPASVAAITCAAGGTALPGVTWAQ